MKSEIRMALLLLASTAAPAFAQGVTPQCAALFDSTQNSFTAMNAPGGAPNAQCFLTVLPKDGQYSDASFPQLSQYPAPQLQEGTYEIRLSGGGGGGGGGADSGNRKSAAAGSDGGSAVHSSSTQYLAPGIYKLTIGTGGYGGASGELESGNANLGGERGQDGNPTAMTKAYTNETIAGFPGADAWNGGWASRDMSASAGSGNSSRAVGSAGSGGEAGYKSSQHGQSGDMGGAGFVSLRPIQLAQATPIQRAPAAPAYVAPAPAYVAPAPAYVAPAPVYVAPERARKQDRN